uniref:Non-specific serine/threonine protein kinase n=1 Tax=Rhabditophanes sp. KR3021 TaxID=114890 RepID=A0AC35UHB6_9BILA
MSTSSKPLDRFVMNQIYESVKRLKSKDYAEEGHDVMDNPNMILKEDIVEFVNIWELLSGNEFLHANRGKTSQGLIFLSGNKLRSYQENDEVTDIDIKNLFVVVGDVLAMLANKEEDAIKILNIICDICFFFTQLPNIQDFEVSSYVNEISDEITNFVTFIFANAMQIDYSYFCDLFGFIFRFKSKNEIFSFANNFKALDLPIEIKIRHQKILLQMIKKYSIVDIENALSFVTQNHFIELIKAVSSSGRNIPALFEMFEYIYEFMHIYKGELQILWGFVLLPFYRINDIQQLNKIRNELHHIFDRFTHDKLDCFSEPLFLSLSVRCLSKIKLPLEITLNFILDALNSESVAVKETILNNIGQFIDITTQDFYAPILKAMIDKFVKIDCNDSLCISYVYGISNFLCSTAKVNGSIEECSVCNEGISSNLIALNTDQQFIEKLCTLMNLSLQDKDTVIQCVLLFRTLLNHVQLENDTLQCLVHPFIKIITTKEFADIPIMQECFKIVIKRGLSLENAKLLDALLFILPSDECYIYLLRIIEECQDDDIVIRYVSTCITMAINVDQHKDENFMKIGQKIINMVGFKIGVSLEILYKRFSFSIIPKVTKMMIERLHKCAVKKIDNTVEEKTKIMLDYLKNVVNMFDLIPGTSKSSTMKAFITNFAYKSIPYMLFTGTPYKTYTDFLFKFYEKMCEMSVDALIGGSMQGVLERYLKCPNQISVANDYIKLLAGKKTLVDFLEQESTSTRITLLANIAENQKNAMVLLQVLYYGEKITDSSSITIVDIFKDNCLGLCIGLRFHILDESNFYQCSTGLKSLDMILNVLGSEYLNVESSHFISLLRTMTVKGVDAIKPWESLIRQIEDFKMSALFPQLLTSISPFFIHKESKNLLSMVFNFRKKNNGTQYIVERFDRIISVIYELELKHIVEKLSLKERKSFDFIISRKYDTNEVILNCAKVICEEGFELVELSLKRLNFELNGTALEDCILQELIPALFYAIRTYSYKNIKRLCCLVLGKVGAVDPGRLKNEGLVIESGQNDTIKYANAYIDKTTLFVTELIENLVLLIHETVNSYHTDRITLLIQLILRNVAKNNEWNKNVISNLSEKCRQELSKIDERKNFFEVNKNIVDARTPVVKHLKEFKFNDWKVSFFRILSNSLNKSDIALIFDDMNLLVVLDNTKFFFYLLKNLILQGLIEKSNEIKRICLEEMRAIFELCLTDNGWIRLVANSFFTLLDELEEYANLSIHCNIKLTNHIKVFVSEIYLLRTVEDNLSVAAANACGCYFRSLRLTEQYLIEKSGHFNQKYYHCLAKISSALNDTDAVLGTFECIEDMGEPTYEESILALEAARKYAESLPLYKKNNKESAYALAKCLLQTDNPQSALTYICSGLSHAMDLNDEVKVNEFKELQIEALSKMSEWKLLDKVLSENDSNTFKSWEATSAAIFNSMNNTNLSAFENIIEDCYKSLEVSLSTVVVQNSENYMQAYTHIQKLHMLSEITDAKGLIFEKVEECDLNENIKKLVAKWKKRTDKCMQGSAALEPILENRRQIFKQTKCREGSNAMVEQFLHSARLAQFEDNLDCSWTHILHAKEIGGELTKIALEEAPYLIKKNNQGRAIKMLKKSLRRNYPTLSKIYDDKFEPLSYPDSMETDALYTEEDKIFYVKAQLKLIKYVEAAGSSTYIDITNIFNSLLLNGCPKVQIEEVWYKYAVFLDSHSDNGNNIGNMQNVMNAYTNTLKEGSNYAHHAVSRILTIWLDTTDKFGTTQQQNTVAMNSIIITGFTRLYPVTIFYRAISQILSRISHKVESVFVILKEILILLIEQFPDHCIWHMMALYISSSKKTKAKTTKDIRSRRIEIIINEAFQKFKNQHFESKMNAYKYFAELLLTVGEKATSRQNIDAIYMPFLISFFEKGEMHTMGTTKRKPATKLNCLPSILLPLSAMLDGPMSDPTFNSYNLTQMNSFDSTSSSHLQNRKNIYIRSISKVVEIMASLIRPKKIILFGSDGKEYPMLCKGSDELRKDLRVVEFNKLVNNFLVQDPQSRRQQLRIRTYTVIPLDEKGGIIEWINNLTTLKSTMMPLYREMNITNAHDQQVFSDWNKIDKNEERKRYLTSKLYPIYKPVMAEYFRRKFVEPGKWYNARLQYTKTCAVMSVAGFIYGLGDRHSENILLDTKNGEIVHVDYNILFNKGETLTIAEIVPFRLTKNIVAGFGPTGVNGSFKKACELSLGVMRNNSQALTALLHSFIHDPLLEWSKIESRNQQYRQNNTNGGHSTFDSGASMEAASVVKYVKLRLNGFICSPICNPIIPNSMQMSVSGQVDKLISIASSDAELCQMYAGWAPHL